MDNFAKYTYLNNYVKKFRQKLPLENLTVQDLHQALSNVNIKPKNGTMYERKDVEYALNFEPLLNKIRNYLGINTPSSNNNIGKEKFIPKNEILPNYYSSEEMKDASDELLRNDGIFNENKIKITENDLRKIVEECVKKIKSYYL